MDSIGGRVTDDETRATVAADRRSCWRTLGHTVVEAPLPDVGHFAEDFLLYWATLALFLSRTGKLTFNRQLRPQPQPTT